jgi:hypothetical protein
MDNNEARKMILKPAKTSLKMPEQNGSSGHHSFAFANNPFLKCDNKEESEVLRETSNKEDAASAKESNTNDLFKSAKPSNLFTNPTTASIGFVFGQNLLSRVVTVS